MTNISIHTH